MTWDTFAVTADNGTVTLIYANSPMGAAITAKSKGIVPVRILPKRVAQYYNCWEVA